jgi:spore germination protein GerM
MDLKLANNADVVANIAPLLGFVPTNSIVIYLLHYDNDQLLIRSVGRLDAALPETTVQAAIADLVWAPTRSTPSSWSPSAPSGSTTTPASSSTASADP